MGDFDDELAEQTLRDAAEAVCSCFPAYREVSGHHAGCPALKTLARRSEQVTR